MIEIHNVNLTQVYGHFNMVLILVSDYDDWRIASLIDILIFIIVKKVQLHAGAMSKLL